MTYTPLDPKRLVNLFADLQIGTIELATTNEPARVRRSVGAMAKLAHLFEIPVIVTTVPSEGGARHPGDRGGPRRPVSTGANYHGRLHPRSDA